MTRREPRSPRARPEVRDPLAAVGHWLWHLFVLPPEEAGRWPRWLRALLARPLARLAAALGIAQPTSLRAWIIGLALRSPPPGGWRAPPGAWQQPQALPGLLRAWLEPRLAPLRHRLERALDRATEATRGALSRQSPAGRRLAAALALLALVVVAATPLAPADQFRVFGVLMLAALLLRELQTAPVAAMLMAISLLASSRYILWRVTQTLSPALGLEWWLSLGLLAAEAYTWTILALGYLQNARPLGREIAPLPADRDCWPTVDVLIPTYHEPLAVVRPTVLAALGLDWPAQRLRVYLLDDGDRAEFRAFAAAAGAHYIARADHRHAKAGNLNHALAASDGEFVAVFDCDHIPVRDFLTATLGWLVRDPRCALVQTPHHFFSPDPFERNLGTFRRVPNEGGLFYGLVQDGNDLWNAAFFCGSCAVLRRSALLEVGGLATDTVTEDAHTSLRLHRAGYGSAYLRRVLAAGLATENLASHVRQRVRWARGMAQIFSLDNPLTGRGLSLYQRLCYANAMLHFFSGLPRLVFLTAPLAYLYFEFHVINAAAVTIAAYALPHLVMSAIANSYMQRRFRHSVWNEAYEAALSWYIALPTLVALVNPRLGKFDVTAKGGLIPREYFDWRIALPYLALVAVNLGGALLAVPRLLYWNTHEAGTVVINLCWTLFNLTLLGAVLGVATETRQVRRTPRVTDPLPARVALPDGTRTAAVVLDYSLGGARLALDGTAPSPGTPVTLAFDDAAEGFAAEVLGGAGGRLRVRFLPMSLADERRFVAQTFARPEAWSRWNDTVPPDRPLWSLVEVLSFGAAGYARLATLGAERLRALWRRRVPAASVGG
jgi:cellulose synthase (UDP-forming)